MRWLVAASLFFYGWWSPEFVLLLAGSISVNYVFGQQILRLALAGRQGTARRWLIAGIGVDLALLGWFKYANFLLQNLAAAAGWRAPELDIFLPLAISFFTFQQIIFLVESYRARRAATDMLHYTAFVSLLPASDRRSHPASAADHAATAGG